jgi:hypothetical protein
MPGSRRRMTRMGETIEAHAGRANFARKMAQFALLLGAILFTSSAYCGSGGKTWDTHPFILDKDVLSPNYAGHDPAAVANFLIRNVKPKSEYESDQEFTSRLNKLCEKTMLGDTKVSDILAFSIPIDSIEYNANKKSMIVMAHESEMRAGQRILDLYPGFIFKREQTNHGTYQVENLFGARRTVSKLSDRKFGLHIAREHQYKRQTISVEFDADSEQARRLKGKKDLALIVIGHLQAPMIIIGDSDWLPDMDHLVENKEHAEIIIFNAENAWVLEKSTGRVLSKTFNLSRF